MLDTDIYLDKDAHRALQLLTAAANRGDPEALYSLARRYEEGEGVPQDPKQAYNLAKRAADNNHPKVAFITALVLLYGGVIPKNLVAASHYFLLSFANGYVRSGSYLVQIDVLSGNVLDWADLFTRIEPILMDAFPITLYALGAMHMRDDPFKKDLVESAKWILAARYLGLDENAALDILNDALTSAEIEDAKKRALSWISQASKNSSSHLSLTSKWCYNTYHNDENIQRCVTSSITHDENCTPPFYPTLIPQNSYRSYAFYSYCRQKVMEQ